MEIHYTYPEVTLLLPSVLNVGFLWKIRDIMKQSVYAKMSIYLIVMRDYCDLAEGIWEIIQTAGSIIMTSRGAKPRGMTLL